MKARPPTTVLVSQQLLKDLRRHGPSLAANIAQRLGMNTRAIGNVLRLLRRQNAVQVVDKRCQTMLWWITTDQPYQPDESAELNPTHKDLANDPEHLNWMKYWRARWQARQERLRSRANKQEARP